jgi:hypothetical protein
MLFGLWNQGVWDGPKKKQAWRRCDMHAEFCSKNLKKKENLVELGIDGLDRIKSTLNK